MGLQMDFTENTLKKLKEAIRSVQDKDAQKGDEIREVRNATGKLVLHTVAHRLLADRVAEASRKVTRPTVGTVAGNLLVGYSLGGRLERMHELTVALDRLFAAQNAAKKQTDEPVEPTEPEEEPIVEEEPAVEEEPIVEEEIFAEETPVIEEEPAVETFVAVEEPVAEVETEDEDGDDEEDESDALIGVDTSDLEFIDVMAEPERYAEMQEQERLGLVRLVSRYRRSFLSRLSQSRGNVQEYYSVIKNAMLFYKGVKGRVSWGYESFNRGRVKLAKVNAKSSTLYLYLALDPAELEGTKYNFTDVSNKKKYAATPVLLKIKGERKLKHALELIGKLCGEVNALPTVKNYEIVDYTVAEQTTEELVQAGLIRQFTAAVPVGAFETGIDPATL